MHKRRFLSLILAFIMIFTPLSQVMAADGEITVERIAGSNRYETSILINKRFERADTVVITSGEQFADALSGGQLAALLEMPLYITPKAGLSNALIAELDRLGTTYVYLVGGESSLSKNIENQLAGITVKRLAGANRYETSRIVAQQTADYMENLPANTILASGESFPDALSATSYVNAQRGIMHLAPNNPLAINADYKNWEFVGGANTLQADNVKRISGANRYDTSYEVMRAAMQTTETDVLFIADGQNYPDALSGAGLASVTRSPILLAPRTGLSANILEYIKDNFSKIVVLGGENSIPKIVLDQITGKTPEEPANPLYPVTRVVDGDTIVVNINGVDEKVRLIGIDTPESVHPDSTLNSELGKIASDFTTKLLSGKSVTLEMDVQERDKYGRILAYVYLDGVMVNKTLLSAGMAQVATYPPNVKYVEDFKALEKIARDGNVGLWGDINIEDTPVTEEPKPVDPKPADPKPADPKPGNPTRENWYGRTNEELDKNWSGQIKGNINSDGEKIYHVPGWSSYDRTKIDTSKGERWFSTEREAINAGWRPDKSYMR